MNPSPLPQPVNSSTSHGLRAGQIPTSHNLLDFEQVETLDGVIENSLAELESRFATYVTHVSLTLKPRR